MFTVADDSASNWGSSGRDVGIHALLTSFAEGNGKKRGLPSSEQTRGTGVGVTWACPADQDISNKKADGPTWGGGDFTAAPTDTVLHTNGLTTGDTIEFDVTADVAAGTAEWLIKKVAGHGNVRYVSKEGADEEQDETLAPRLVLTFGP